VVVKVIGVGFPFLYISYPDMSYDPLAVDVTHERIMFVPETEVTGEGTAKGGANAVPVTAIEYAPEYATVLFEIALTL
jgi:hypothetical protein